MKKVIYTLILLCMILFISCGGEKLPAVNIDKEKFEGKIISIDKVVYLEAEPFLKKLHLTPSVKSGKILSGYEEIDKKLEKYYVTKDNVIYISALEASKALGATGTVMAEYNTIGINTTTMAPFPAKPASSTGDGASPFSPGTYLNRANDVKNQVDQFQNQ